MPLPQQPGDGADEASVRDEASAVSPEVAFVQAKMRVISGFVVHLDARLILKLQWAIESLQQENIDEARNHLGVIYQSLTEQSYLSRVPEQDREILFAALFDAISGRDGAYAEAVADQQSGGLTHEANEGTVSSMVGIVGLGEFMQEAAFPEVGERG